MASIPRSGLRRLAEYSRPASRLLRHELRALLRLSDGTLVASSREGVFAGSAGHTLAPSRIDASDREIMPPLRMCRGPDDTVVWGEYVGRRPTRTIRILASVDRGTSFHVVHTFATGSIFHVHNLLWDPARGHYWVFCGDHGEEPGIGMLSSDFARFEWFVRGSQRFRLVTAFDFGDRLVYGTDTELERNRLVILDKETGAFEETMEFEGSCLYACRYGRYFTLSTTVEPSAVNKSPFADLWISEDGARWQRILRARKDPWPASYFQFGSLVLPSGSTADDRIAVSGQAVSGLDGKTAFGTAER